MSCKLHFWPAAYNSAVLSHPLGRVLLDRALEKEFIKMLDMTKRAKNRVTTLKLEHLFSSTADADVSSLSQPPQLILAGSLAVQAALSECWAPSDVDLFCTWAETSAVRALSTIHKDTKVTHLLIKQDTTTPRSVRDRS